MPTAGLVLTCSSAFGCVHFTAIPPVTSLASHPRIRSGARLAFPVALFLFAGLFFGGRLGWWSDDYWHNLRDPVTGRVGPVFMDRGFFLRPLFYRIVPAVTTLLWHDDRVAHAIQL